MSDIELDEMYEARQEHEDAAAELNRQLYHVVAELNHQLYHDRFVEECYWCAAEVEDDLYY
jgi:hypothetical protein